MGDLNNEHVITMSARQVNHCYANNNAWLSLIWMGPPHSFTSVLIAAELY